MAGDDFHYGIPIWYILTFAGGVAERLKAAVC